MAEKILMNKNSLAILKIELKEYNTALPVFEMKEQQLKELIQNLREHISNLRMAIKKINQETSSWIAVFAEDVEELEKSVQIKKMHINHKEVAGVKIKEIEKIMLEDIQIDTFQTPLWIDEAIELIKKQKINLAFLKIEEENIHYVEEELNEARRMKNALKEVFIPETNQNIRKIEIYLGDVERLAIGCAKLVKKKKLIKNAQV